MTRSIWLVPPGLAVTLALLGYQYLPRQQEGPMLVYDEHGNRMESLFSGIGSRAGKKFHDEAHHSRCHDRVLINEPTLGRKGFTDR